MARAAKLQSALMLGADFTAGLWPCPGQLAMVTMGATGRFVIVPAIKKRGGTVQLKIYEDEGHAFGRWENVIDQFKRVSDFLKVQVPSPGCGCELTE